MPRIRIKPIREAPAPGDGFRVLVDRIWPRGISKERAALDLWAKDIAPSTGLRKWFGHDPARWDEFRARYRAELEPRRAELRTLLDQSGGRPLTLLFAAHDTVHNQAVVLKTVLDELDRQEPSAPL